MEFDDGNYEQEEETEPDPPRHRNKARRRAYPFIDDEADVDGEASGDEGIHNENDYLDGSIVADDVLVEY